MPDSDRLPWQELCQLVKADDGLPVRQSGQWAANKLHFWNRYLEITTTAMVGHKAWQAGVCYVDLFAGPGICEVRATGERFPGSPLMAAHTPKPFTRILLCELSKSLSDACVQRLEKSPANGRFEMFAGDCNSQIDAVVAGLPSGSLTLAFLDPTGLHLHFETVTRLATHGPVDLLILFPDAVDILRNVKHVYFDQPESNLDLVLGPDLDWREKYKQFKSREGKDQRKLFVDIYKQQLQRLAGYDYFADEVIRGPSGPLYRLVYATKHQRGIDFWNKSVKKELSGQTRMW